MTIKRGKKARPKLKLPPVAAPPRSNQPSDDSNGARWDPARHRRSRCRRRRELEPLPQLAYVYLPTAVSDNRRHDERRHRRDQPSKEVRRCRRRRYDSSSSSGDEESSTCSDDGNDRAPQSSSMRSQRLCSLAAMSKLRHAAAATIQVEYRLYRRRLANRNRRNQRLTRQAQAFLDVFLRQELQASLVPACLLEVLLETRAEEITRAKRREDISTELAGGVLTSLIDECIRDVFHSVLQSMVGSYLAERLDLTRAATSPSRAVAADVLGDWISELVGELLPEVLSDMVSECTAHLHPEYNQQEQDQLKLVAPDAQT